MEQETKSYKKSSFGPAFLFLSKRRRAALAHYYEFCRRMDDLADEPGVENPSKELDFWQEEVSRIFQGRAQTGLGKLLAADVAEFALPQERFLLLIEGMRADLGQMVFPTLASLEWYLYRVAVVVGMATLDILGIKGPQADALAKDLGTAVQLTNIVRDVTADAQLGRVYLPEALLLEAGQTRQAVLEGREPEKTARVLGKLAALAENLYARAEQQMRGFARLKMLPCRTMGCVYALNLAKIKKTGFLPGAPVKLTRAEKLRGVLHAWSKTLLA